MKPVAIITGAMCNGNPGPGGWAALLRMGRHEKALSGAEDRTTPHRMELRALHEALRILIEPCDLTIHAGGPFLAEGHARWSAIWTVKGWSSLGKRPVRNAELWHAVIGQLQGHLVTWAAAEAATRVDLDHATRLAANAMRPE
jgi:ribonuclease HI